MMKRPLAITMAATLALGAGNAVAEELQQRAASLFSPIPQEPPVIDGNEMTDAKIELGKMLFFEPRLSASHLIS